MGRQHTGQRRALIPILTPADVRAIDRRALGEESIEKILERVGLVVANAAIEILGGTANKRVVAIVGPGLNGADARAAATVLEAQGVHVELLNALDLPKELPDGDLVLDGAFGIGLSKSWDAPDVGHALVLAIDIPSGIDGESGLALGTPMRATRTVTLGGFKSGLLFGDGPDYCGEVVVGDIGLPAEVDSHLIEETDVRGWIPTRRRTAHKWMSALLVVAGSEGMTGAARLTGASALRAGAGYVHLVTRASPDPGLASEIVRSSDSDRLPDLSRFAAAVVGPGMSTAAHSAELATTMIQAFEGPMVVDGDGLTIVAGLPEVLSGRDHPTVLTPHDGEFERLAGRPPGSNRMEAAMELAAKLSSVVLLKGPATVIAHPNGQVRVSNAGDQRLATAGTGDVLAGLIGAFLAQGTDAFDAASAAAYLHGAAAGLGEGSGLIASDLLRLIPEAIDSIRIRRPNSRA